MVKPKSLVCGVGVNDADYSVKPANGKACDFYNAWIHMLRRCYSSEWTDKYPTYIGCSVCEDWIYFSGFKAWMIKQDWQGKELDKDILFKGNKVYSPETCVFVTSLINTFITDCGSARGEMPIGVNKCNKTGKVEVRCRNPFTSKKEYLGRFLDIDSAHQAWRRRKHELACQLAGIQTDERVAVALRVLYL